MGHRLSKIYTRTGDRGDTGLGGGTRVDKDDPRVEACGSVDELNSVLGMVLAEDPPEAVRACLLDVQHDLFDLGGELCLPGHTVITPEYVARLERILDRFNADLPPLEEFILPGGGRAASACHLARTVCRRVERRLVTLRRDQPVGEEALRYLNRLSDLLFVFARVLARQTGAGATMWRRRESPPSRRREQDG